MQILVHMGMTVSNPELLIPSNGSNPMGFYEDIEILDIHKKLLRDLGERGCLPLPDNWIQSQKARKASREIINLLKLRVFKENTQIFGIKDPRLSTLLPLWHHAFNKLKIVPRYIISIRHPEAFVASMNREYGITQDIAELIWLNRTLDSLEHSALDSFIVHYESWFDKPYEIADQLHLFTGLDQVCEINNWESIESIIKPKMSHSMVARINISNPLITKLYVELQHCHGTNFNRENLTNTVVECREMINAFKGWQRMARNNSHDPGTLNQTKSVEPERDLEPPYRRKNGRTNSSNALQSRVGHLDCLLDELNQSLDALRASVQDFKDSQQESLS